MSSDDEDNRGTEEDYEYEYSDEDNHGGDDDEDVSMAGSSDAADAVDDVGSRKTSDASSTKKRPFRLMDRRKNSFGGDNPNAPPGGKFGFLSGTPPTVILLSKMIYSLTPSTLLIWMRRRWIWNTHASRG